MPTCEVLSESPVRLREGGSNAIAVELDVRDSAAWEEAVADTEREFGKVDTLCNIAGANFRVGFDEQTEEMWHTIIDTNLTAYFLGTKAVVPAMRRGGQGSHPKCRFARLHHARARQPGIRGRQDRPDRSYPQHRGRVREGQHPLRVDLSWSCGH